MAWMTLAGAPRPFSHSKTALIFIRLHQAQNGRLFGRQGFMGLINTSWGTLTMGRQYDSVVDYLGPNTGAAWYASIGDSDNTWNDLRIQNSVKYSTPEVRGFKAEALYGFSNTGSFNDNSVTLTDSSLQ
jgi:GBP family porin